jgi:hypothetical protein
MEKESNIWNYIKMISETKEIPEFDDTFEKLYNQFVVNRAMSLYGDTSVLIANMINTSSKMTNKNHFLFLHAMIRKGKRWSKWPKKTSDSKIDFIMEEFNYSKAKAKEVVNLITDMDIKSMKKDKDTGGAI